MTAAAERPLVLGHRGASRDAPENTIAAFVRPRELGADGVEFDVHRTADAVLVVHHDAELDDLGLVLDASFAELHAARPDVADTRGDARRLRRDAARQHRDEVRGLGRRP